jgi:transposase-like protein
MKNRYINLAKISDDKFRQLLKCFSLDLTASDTAKMVGLNRNTVNRIYTEMRQRIYLFQCETSPVKPEKENFKADESYFGPRRIRGKRGRGVGSKIIVFGLFKRSGNVYTEIVPDVKSTTLSAIIRGKVDIHTDGWRAYDGLVDLGFEKHFQVNHSKNEFSKGDGNHINGIESFWAFAKHRLAKFHGVPKKVLEIHLKETEFRFNNRGKNLYKILLKMFRENPLF